MPMGVRIALGALAIGVLAIVVNWSYQVIRKPSELFFPVSGSLNKTPAETWERYAAIFNQYSTRVITPDLLAAMAQVEGSGNPLVRTYWRWSWSLHPFEVYRPASSAVGMFQIIDGTFAEAKRYCIVNHRVVESGSGNGGPCAFNAYYTRVMPAQAVELTAAYLDRSVALTLERRGIGHASMQQKQQLAAVVHLCGAGGGDLYAKRGFRLSPGQRCGDHEVREYLARIDGMKRVFDRLARQERATAVSVARPAAGEKFFAVSEARGQV
jgi:hypothetical protein